MDTFLEGEEYVLVGPGDETVYQDGISYEKQGIDIDGVEIVELDYRGGPGEEFVVEDGITEGNSRVVDEPDENSKKPVQGLYIDEHGPGTAIGQYEVASLPELGQLVPLKGPSMLPVIFGPKAEKFRDSLKQFDEPDYSEETREAAKLFGTELETERDFEDVSIILSGEENRITDDKRLTGLIDPLADVNPFTEPAQLTLATSDHEGAQPALEHLRDARNYVEEKLQSQADSYKDVNVFREWLKHR
jgi:hypothetical protein